MFVSISERRATKELLTDMQFYVKCARMLTGRGGTVCVCVCVCGGGLAALGVCFNVGDGLKAEFASLSVR